ncbi:MAG: DNA-3-methyladenine glycosylase [Rickettsiaceae bacterium]|nr:MAG: DNA-3-methyladenine glycosylase [Rickettsiaceae bacterium]
MNIINQHNKTLQRDFFEQSCTKVARDLLGKILIFKNYVAIITETESYRGADDPASHAFRGPTPRAKIMFGLPGISYVYLIYGIYNCLNVVTEVLGSPSAVLIRSVKLIEPYHKVINGPGKICRELGICRSHNNIDLTMRTDFHIQTADDIAEFVTTPRIGIKVGTDKLWRFTTTVI